MLKLNKSSLLLNNLTINNLTNNTTKKNLIENFLKEKNLVPVFVYDDLSSVETKKNVLNETRKLSGIYLILNKITLDYYIGSASTNRFYSRFQNHLFNFSGSKVIKNAVKKYKLNSFSFIILELFEEIVSRENNKKLLDLEDFYLKSLLPNYNILTEAGSSFGYKHSEVSRLKMKANYSEERRLAIGNLNKGKKLDAKTIEAIRKSLLNKTKETRNYSLTGIQNMKKNCKGVIIYNVNGTVYGNFNSIVEAACAIGTSTKTITRALKKKNSTPFYKRRFLAEYVKT